MTFDPVVTLLWISIREWVFFWFYICLLCLWSLLSVKSERLFGGLVIRLFIPNRDCIGSHVHHNCIARPTQVQHYRVSRNSTGPKYMSIVYGQCTKYGGCQVHQTLCLGAWCRWLSSLCQSCQLSDRPCGQRDGALVKSGCADVRICGCCNG